MPIAIKDSTIDISSEKLTNDLAKELSELNNISIVCGRYEGVDQRIIDEYADYEISIGDYVVSGGEIPGVILMDSISRLIPGVVGNKQSVETDSLNNSLLKHPVYTRPEKISNKKVPKILVSGNHKKIKEFNRESSLVTTLKMREDLLSNAELTIKERNALRKIKRDTISSNSYLALVHYPIQNIKGEIIRESIQ